MPKCLEHTEDDHAAAVTEVDGVGSKNWLRMRGGGVFKSRAKDIVGGFRIRGFP